MIQKAASALITWARQRKPDFVVGGVEQPYLLRWFLIPRNPVFNVYLHCFLRDDDDRALHDHPWPWCSILLSGGYIEHTIAAGGIHRRRERSAPSIKLSGPRRAHRIELLKIRDFVASQPGNDTPISCWTLFITGPRLRTWGFHCPERGWVDWREFTDPNDKGMTGPGCGDQSAERQA
ncbi:hypothetical protein [Marilutibacter spongiae]|uniref:Cysteine dioxygenase n=1 Tax=Marilutibacter spongiae TaxID=2025720 RepID=A0A7W3TPL4_9GAMM|nr:hypothetical protein [Lysobacter spongiae]MBB1061914.1 hypothetical protein [Lysobacter spongiae]